MIRLIANMTASVSRDGGMTLAYQLAIVENRAAKGTRLVAMSGGRGCHYNCRALRRADGPLALKNSISEIREP